MWRRTTTGINKFIIARLFCHILVELNYFLYEFIHALHLLGVHQGELLNKVDKMQEQGVEAIVEVQGTDVMEVVVVYVCEYGKISSEDLSHNWYVVYWELVTYRRGEGMASESGVHRADSY